ncbi:MAG: GNAT family N-acetyltransferase [bacterium]
MNVTTNDEQPVYAFGERTIVRPLDRSDCDSIASWKPYSEPELAPYIIPRRDKALWDQWFSAQTGRNGNAFAIETKQKEFIGFILLSKIDETEGSANLHFQIDPAKSGERLGLDGLRAFLELYFGKWRRETLTATVPAYNLRGRGCLRQCSFVMKDQVWEPEPRGVDVLSIPELAGVRRFFRVVANRTEVQCLVLETTRLTWVSKHERWRSKTDKSGG